MKNTIQELKHAGPQNFEEFFPLYLKAHSNAVNRRLHFLGTSLAILLVPASLLLSNLSLLWLCPVFGYGFAWFGHFFLESNIPATYSNPLWSLRGDFRMYGLMCRGKLWS